MTEIMTELLDVTDETIMAEVSDKLNIGSYDGDGYESGESGYGSPRSESRDFITMTDVDDKHNAAEHNVDLFFSQSKVSILTQPESNGTNIEYHFLEAEKSVPGPLESVEQPSTVTESEIDAIDESAEANWKNISKEEVENVVEYLKKNSPEKPVKDADEVPSKTDTGIETKSEEEIHQSEIREYKMDISDSDSASEEVLFEVLYKNTTPDHHKYKPLLPDCDDGRACHDELCTSTCTNKKCKSQCHQVVRSWRRREQNKRNSTGFQKRNNLHMKALQKEKKQIKIDLEKNKKLNGQLKNEIRLLKLKLSEIEKSKSVSKA